MTTDQDLPVTGGLQPPPDTAEQSIPSTNQTELPENTPANPRRPTLSELALGGALLVTDNVGSRLQVTDEAAEARSRTLAMVLRPATEWDTNPPIPLTTARHVAVGMLTDARLGMGRGGRLLLETTDTLNRRIGRVTRPIRKSRVLRPARDRFHRYQQRGEQQIARWEAIGRREETRSRAVAEVALGGFVQRSVSDLTESDQIQVLVQQVVESQSTGLFGEFLEEIRERMVSLDTLLDRQVRRSATYEPPAAPPFRRAYLHDRPSLASISQVDQTLAGHYAGFASRTAAFFIDVTLLIITLWLATTFVNALVGLFNLETFISRFVTFDSSEGTLVAAIAGLASALFVIGYGVTAWSINGKTVGDMMMGVRVVRADGSRVSFRRATLRMLGAYISGLVLFIGFLWALFDGRKQGWHDKLAGTVVVYDWPAVPDEQFLRQQLGVRGVLPQQQAP